jgi:hypothetical protein
MSDGAALAAEKPETKNKTCSACGQAYEYPLKGSLATRFHCENCATLPAAARKALERLSTRLRKLEKELKKLQTPAG